MIVKQKNLRVFYIKIEQVEEFLAYYVKNRILLKEFFLLIEGEENQAILNLLDEDKVCYKFINSCNIKLLHVKKEALALEEQQEKVNKTLFDKEPIEQPESKKGIITFNRPIRSGEEIHEELPVTVFGRINSGAKLFCAQSVAVFGDIDGLVQCDGEYLICSAITPRGHVIFNGEIIQRESLQGDGLKKIEFKENKLVIKGIA